MVSLRGWLEQNVVSDKMNWKGSYHKQISDIEDIVDLVLFDGYKKRLKNNYKINYEEFKSDKVQVISNHTSKSILLPVVEIKCNDLGIKFILRNNFYDWKLTVISENEIEENFKGLFKTSRGDSSGELSSTFFEGFPEDLVKGYWEENKREWSASIFSTYKLWTVIFLCLRGSRKEQ